MSHRHFISFIITPQQNAFNGWYCLAMLTTKNINKSIVWLIDCFVLILCFKPHLQFSSQVTRINPLKHVKQGKKKGFIFMANLRETIRNYKFPTKFQGFPSGKLHYSNGMWFPPSGKHPTLRLTRFRGRETRETSGFSRMEIWENPVETTCFQIET